MTNLVTLRMGVAIVWHTLITAYVYVCEHIVRAAARIPSTQGVAFLNGTDISIPYILYMALLTRDTLYLTEFLALINAPQKPMRFAMYMLEKNNIYMFEIAQNVVMQVYKDPTSNIPCRTCIPFGKIDL
jgi:uncharacterized membrane protein